MNWYALPRPDIPFGWSDAVDIVATAVLVYYLLVLIRGTRAVPIIIGIAVLAGLYSAANLLHLLVLGTILQFALLGTAVTLPIVFQPELRRLLEQLGRGGMLARPDHDESDVLEASVATLAHAAVILSRNRTGGLIAIEGATGLREFVESGTRLDARLSLELILTVFMPKSPLHDGAMIVKGSLVEAAGCFLPLSENVVVSETHLGTRHRAAIGLSEQTDAVVLVVSEETGAISIARTGKLSRELDDEMRLRNVLLACCRASGRGRPARAVRLRLGRSSHDLERAGGEFAKDV